MRHSHSPLEVDTEPSHRSFEVSQETVPPHEEQEHARGVEAEEEGSDHGPDGPALSLSLPPPPPPPAPPALHPEPSSEQSTLHNTSYSTDLGAANHRIMELFAASGIINRSHEFTSTSMSNSTPFRASEAAAAAAAAAAAQPIPPVNVITVLPPPPEGPDGVQDNDNAVSLTTMTAVPPPRESIATAVPFMRPPRPPHASQFLEQHLQQQQQGQAGTTRPLSSASQPQAPHQLPSSLLTLLGRNQPAASAPQPSPPQQQQQQPEQEQQQQPEQQPQPEEPLAASPPPPPPAAAAAAATAQPPAANERPIPDPNFIAVVPRDIGNEIVFDHMDVIRGTESYERFGRQTRVRRTFLDALPENVQQEVLNTEQRWLRVTGQGDGAPDPGAELVAMLAIVDQETRRDILMTCELEQLANYPEYQQEARALRAQEEARRNLMRQRLAARQQPPPPEVSTAMTDVTRPLLRSPSMPNSNRVSEDRPRLRPFRPQIAEPQASGRADFRQLGRQLRELGFFGAQQMMDEQDRAAAAPQMVSVSPQQLFEAFTDPSAIHRALGPTYVQYVRHGSSAAPVGGSDATRMGPGTPSPMPPSSSLHHRRHPSIAKMDPPTPEKSSSPQVPIPPPAMLRACIRLLKLQQKTPHADTMGRNFDGNYVTTQLVALLRVFCTTPQSAVDTLNALTDAIEDEKENVQLPFVSHVMNVWRELLACSRAVPMCFLLLPDKCFTSATMKSVDAPLDETEREYLRTPPLLGLLRVVQKHMSAKSVLIDSLAVLGRLQRSLELKEEPEDTSTEDPLLHVELSDHVIEHPRHPHRLQWTNTGTLQSYATGFECNVCMQSSKGYAFHCPLCNYDLCPECSRMRTSNTEDAVRMKRCIYYTVSSEHFMSTVLELVRHPQSEDYASKLVHFITPGLLQSARRDVELSNARSPIAIIETALISTAAVSVREIRQCRQSFQQEAQRFITRYRAEQERRRLAGEVTEDEVHQDPQQQSITSPARTPFAGSIQLPEGLTFSIDDALFLLQKLNLVHSSHDHTHLFFLPYAETQRPEPRELMLMWHAAQAYLQDVTMVLQHLQNATQIPLPSSVKSFVTGFCLYHLSEARRARMSTSASASTHSLERSGSLKGDTERFLVESTIDPSPISQQAAEQVANNSSATNDRDSSAHRHHHAAIMQQEDDFGRNGTDTDVRPTLPRTIRRFMDSNRATLGAILRAEPQLLRTTLSFLRSEPSLIDFNLRIQEFRYRLERRRTTRTVVNVDRHRCLEDSFQQLKQCKQFGTLQVRFKDEEGADAGGLTREWFQVLAKDLVNESYALFIHSSEGLTFQPNPLSDVNPNHLEYFRFAGIVMGLAVANNVAMDMHLTRSVYRHMVGIQPVFQDLESVDPELYNNLSWMRKNDVSDLGLTFSVNYERFGEVVEEELQPNGRETAVTNANKMQYVRLLCEFFMTRHIQPQLLELLKGFYMVVPLKEIRYFTPQELELVICGLPEINVDDLRAHTIYEGYTATSPQVRWFWEVVHSMTMEDKANLLQFATGASKVPQGGFSNLESTNGQKQPFTLCRWDGGADLLPQAHTCFNKIDLPEYPTAEVLREKLMLAVTFGSMGFTML